MPSLRNSFRLLASFVYQRQLVFAFPVAMIERAGRMLPTLPEGYESRVVATAADRAAVAALLTEDGQFGAWTAERVKVELLDRLIDPQAALLIVADGQPVACASVIDASTRRKRIAELMYLYVTPTHRGRNSMAFYVTFRTLGRVMKHNYIKVIGATDPWRLPALNFYLANGCVPVKNSLYSYLQWSRVMKKLRPGLVASPRWQARKEAAD